MRHPHTLLLLLGTLLVLCGCRSEAPEKPHTPAPCPPGQEHPADAPDACCFPGQLWVAQGNQGCVGVPTHCLEGFELTSRSCTLKACEPGQERAADGIHCCWPAQGFSSGMGCIGRPDCPEGWALSDDASSCTPDTAPACDTRESCRDACDQGTLTACVSLADLRLHGRRQDDREAARGLYQRACDANLLDGCAGLSLLLARTEPERARTLATQACDAGVPRGCGNLGVFLSRGIGGERDTKRAVSLLRSACDASWGEACADLGYLYRSGAGVERSETRAHELYARGCELGSGFGCANLGAMLDAGVDGAPANPTRAAELYRRACDAGSMLGCTHLGTLHKLGEGIARDYERARALYQKACDGRYARGCLQLGYLHLLGRGTPRDANQAARHFITACELEDPDACFALGKLLIRGEGVPQPSVTEGIALIDSACARDLAEACYTAGLFYTREDVASPKDAAARFSRGCELGHDKSCRALPEAAPVDTDALTQRCMQRDDAEACVRVGARYLFAQGVEKDEARAAIFFERGCDAGILQGCLSLGVLYEHGSGVALDLTRARSLYERACTASLALGCHNLARVLTPTEPERARDLRDRACELGHEDACEL